MEVFFLVIFVVFVAGILWLSYLHARARQKALEDWSLEQNLTFSAQKDHYTGKIYPWVKCLNQGSRRYSYNRMRGEWRGFKLFAFDYHYQTGSGKHTHHYNFSCVIVDSPIELQPLKIRPEGVLDKVSAFLGFDDIDFESHEFSEKFHISSPNKRWAYDIIHPRMMEYLLSQPALSVQFFENKIIAYRNSYFSPQEFAEAADMVCGIIDRIPKYVIRGGIK